MLDTVKVEPNQLNISNYPVGKIAEKAVCIFDNVTLHFERTPSDRFFGDFAHWV